jgi:hypothetical protein
LGLCEEAELEAQMFVLAQMFIRIPNVQFSTEPAFFAKRLLVAVNFYCRLNRLKNVQITSQAFIS